MMDAPPVEESHPVIVEEEAEELFHDEDLEKLPEVPDPTWDDDKTMPPLSFDDVEQFKEAHRETPEVPTEPSDPIQAEEVPRASSAWDEDPDRAAPQDDENVAAPEVFQAAEVAPDPLADPYQTAGEPILESPVVVREPSDPPADENLLSPPIDEEPAGDPADEDIGFTETEKSLFHVPDDNDWDLGDDDDLAWNSGKKSRRKLVTAVFVVLLGVLGGAFFLTSGEEGAASDAAATIGGEADAAVETQAEAPASEEEEVLTPEATALAAEAEALAAAEEAAIAAAEAEAVAAEQVAAEAATPKAAAASAKRASKPATRKPTKKASKPAARKPAKKASKPRASGADGFVAAGREALKEGDFGKARMEFIEAVSMAPNSADANHGLAFAAHKQGDIGTAIRYYCTASRLASPGSSIAREITSSLSNLGAVCE